MSEFRRLLTNVCLVRVTVSGFMSDCSRRSLKVLRKALLFDLSQVTIFVLRVPLIIVAYFLQLFV